MSSKRKPCIYTIVNWERNVYETATEKITQDTGYSLINWLCRPLCNRKAVWLRKYSILLTKGNLWEQCAFVADRHTKFM